MTFSNIFEFSLSSKYSCWISLISWHSHFSTDGVLLSKLIWHIEFQSQFGNTIIVCLISLFVLRFYGPVNPMGSCRARSVYLTTRLLDRLSPLSGYQYCAHSFARNWQLPFLNQRKGENDRWKYFMINLHERMLPTSAGVEPATSWSPVGRRIQMSHRGRHMYAWLGGLNS